MSDTTVPARELTLDIESPAAGGTSIARHDGQVVFVSGGLPGERVRVVTEAGPPAKFLRAQVTEVLEASVLRVPDRRLAFAAPGESAQTDVPAAGACPLEVSGADVTRAEALGAGFGGLEYAHVELAASRDLKAEVLSDQLARIGHTDRDVEVRPAPGETDGTDWRTRVQLAVDSEGRAGMLAARSHDVIPVTRPPLAAGALADLELGRLRLPGLRRLAFAWAGHHRTRVGRRAGRPRARPSAPDRSAPTRIRLGRRPRDPHRPRQPLPAGARRTRGLAAEVLFTAGRGRRKQRGRSRRSRSPGTWAPARATAVRWCEAARRSRRADSDRDRRRAGL